MARATAARRQIFQSLTVNSVPLVAYNVFPIGITSLVLFLSLRYNEMTLDSGAQIKPSGSGRAGELLLSGMVLTGHFFLSFLHRVVARRKLQQESTSPFDIRYSIFLTRRSGASPPFQSAVQRCPIVLRPRRGSGGYLLHWCRLAFAPSTQWPCRTIAAPHLYCLIASEP